MRTIRVRKTILLESSICTYQIIFIDVYTDVVVGRTSIILLYILPIYSLGLRVYFKIISEQLG